MATVPENLPSARKRLERALSEILAAYEREPPAAANATTGPARLAKAASEFMLIAERIDAAGADTTPVLKDDVTRLGDHALTVLHELSVWTAHLKIKPTRERLETVILSTADWIARHRGEIRTLEPVADALAHTANRMRDPKTLEGFARFISRIIEAVAPFIRQDVNKTDPGRPWRVLHTNRGIVATRSHNVQLMEQIFDELVEALPGEAAQFFAEGMEQMQLREYPDPVRSVMVRYFDRWARPRMH
jgi:hypothetical protein